eukprot:COSAG01_NODE_2402_length_7759_cov_9.960313_11_plen_98_part_00
MWAPGSRASWSCVNGPAHQRVHGYGHVPGGAPISSISRRLAGSAPTTLAAAAVASATSQLELLALLRVRAALALLGLLLELGLPPRHTTAQARPSSQ